MKKIFFIFIVFFNFLYAFEQLENFTSIHLKTKIELQSECHVNHFIIANEIFFLGVGSIFDDSTLKSTACVIKYNIKTKELIDNKSFNNVDSFYKIISYKHHYFLLGSRALSEQENIGRSYADKGYIGVLIKLDMDEAIEKYLELPLNGFGNVRDFQVNDDQIAVLSVIKNSTIYDNDMYATVNINYFNTNLLFLNTIQIKSKDYLADALYIVRDIHILTDNYHNKICAFNKVGLLETCFDFNDNTNEITKIEKLKKFYSKNYQISAYDITFHYALKQEIRYEQKLNRYLNIQYLYEIGDK